jgi:uncharacterized protein YpmS
MKSTWRTLFFVLLALACLLPVAMLLLQAAHSELEQALSCILSTEVAGPALIFTLAWLVYVVHKAESASQ